MRTGLQISTKTPMNKKSTDVAASGNEALYLFFGDEFLVKEQVHGLIDKTIEPELRNTNLIVLDGNSLDLGDLSALLFTPSLFGGGRVILVEQATMFMGRGNQDKLLAKVTQSWKTGDRKVAMKTFTQLLAVSGVDTPELAGGSEWMSMVTGKSASAEDRDVLADIARAFVEEGGRIPSGSDEAAIEELITSVFPEQTVLIFTAPSADKRKKVFKTLQKRGRVVECAVREQKYGAGLDRSFFDKRVKETLSKAGKSIAQDALDEMYSRSGKELRRLHGEVEKLIGFVGDRERITVKDVESVFTDFHEAAFFDLINALRTADIRRCLPALHENLRLVDHPLQTLAVIAGDIRKLMAARELLFTIFRSSWRPGMSFESFKPLAARAREEYPELASKGKHKVLSFSDYPLYFALRDAQKFPMDKLVRIMESILEADIMMKSSRLGNQSPGSILENLVFTICSPVDRAPHASTRGQGSHRTA